MDISSVQESYARCTLKSGFIDRFYEVFLASHPSLAPRFANTNMADQKGLLRTGISMMLLFSKENSMATNALNRIGETHKPEGYGHSTQHVRLLEGQPDAGCAGVRCQAHTRGRKPVGQDTRPRNPVHRVQTKWITRPHLIAPKMKKGGPKWATLFLSTAPKGCGFLVTCSPLGKAPRVRWVKAPSYKHHLIRFPRHYPSARRSDSGLSLSLQTHFPCTGKKGRKLPPHARPYPSARCSDSGLTLSL